MEKIDGAHVHLVHRETGAVRIEKLSVLEKWQPGIDFQVVHPNCREEAIDLLARSDAERKMLRKLPTDGVTAAVIAEFLVRKRWLDVLHSRGYERFAPSDLDMLEVRYLAKQHNLPVRTTETLAQYERVGIQEGAFLLPSYASRGGKGRLRGTPKMEEMIAQVIALARDGKVDLTVLGVKKELEGRIAEIEPSKAKQFILPSDGTLRRRLLDQASPHDLAVFKYGKKRADRLFNPTGARAKVTESGLVYEFDDTDTRVFCLEPRTCLPWGRPWITSGVCQHSGFPVGMAMDTIPLSTQSALSALVNSIEVKDLTELNSSHGSVHVYTWEASGYPTQGLFDNALYNSPRILSLNADVADASWARPYTPTDKREIEYFNGRAKTYFSTLPGFRGPSNDMDALKEGLGTAVLSVSNLRLGFLKWMLGEEANRPGQDGLTSRQRYLETDRVLKLNRRSPPDTRRLRMLRMLSLRKPVTWNRYGISVMGGLLYQDEDLFRRWINRPGGSMKVNVRIDPENLTAVYVIVPNSDVVLVVSSCYPEYVDGMTLYTHKLVLKMCKQKKITNPSIHDLWATRTDLKNMVAQWAQDAKVVIRRRAVAARNAKALKEKQKQESYATTALEQGCDELNRTEMDEEEEGWAIPTD